MELTYTKTKETERTNITLVNGEEILLDITFTEGQIELENIIKLINERI